MTIAENTPPSRGAARRRARRRAPRQRRGLHPADGRRVRCETRDPTTTATASDPASSRLPPQVRRAPARRACASRAARSSASRSRARCSGPKLLLLDEATSALDSGNEAVVQAALDNLMQGKTTVVIAHRLSTVVRATQIIVLDKGVAVERGTHQQLCAKPDSKYAYFMRHQLVGEEMDAEEKTKSNVSKLTRRIQTRREHRRAPPARRRSRRGPQRHGRNPIRCCPAKPPALTRGASRAQPSALRVQQRNAAPLEPRRAQSPAASRHSARAPSPRVPALGASAIAGPRRGKKIRQDSRQAARVRRRAAATHAHRQGGIKVARALLPIRPTRALKTERRPDQLSVVVPQLRSEPHDRAQGEAIVRAGAVDELVKPQRRERALHLGEVGERRQREDAQGAAPSRCAPGGGGRGQTHICAVRRRCARRAAQRTHRSAWDARRSRDGARFSAACTALRT